jgi:putative hemolysin
VAGNHPLGGPDGLALMAAVGRYRNDIQFPVNDFLLYLPGLAPLFVPIDKVNRNTANVNALENAFASENVLLYFPAGLCSRKQKGGQIRDLEWKPTFIKKAVKYKRDVVPFFFDARNRKRFYNLARLRERLGIKFNFEMALLPAEMFAQCGNTLQLIVGKPIPYTTFDKRLSAKEWAQRVQDYIYGLKEDPTAEFKI